MSLLPIIITAYNRPDHLHETLSALRNCDLAEQSDLYIFVDGPKHTDEQYVGKMDQLLSGVDGFKSVTLTKHEANIGLAQNVISSVTKVMQEFRGAIVLEDDMVVNRHFLRYMNDAFEFYYEYPEIGSITAYSPPIKKLSTLENEVFFSTRTSTWGWSMRSEDWLRIPWHREHYEILLQDEQFVSDLNRAGNDRVGLLKAYLNNRLNIWGIRRGSWQIEQKMMTVYPTYSLLRNIGLDGSGIHCGTWNNHDVGYDPDFRPENFIIPERFIPSPVAEEALRNFYSK